MPSELPPAWVIAHRVAIGDNIRTARERALLSQERLAELVGRDRQTINRIELGRHATRIDTLIRIAHAIGIPLSELVRD